MKRLAVAALIVAFSLASFAAARAHQAEPASPANPQTAPATAQPASPQVPASTLVAVLVKIPIPGKLDRTRLIAIMQKTVPEFQALPGLVRKYYTISDDQKFGGVYLFENRQAADAHFDDAWKAKMLKNYGAPAEVEYFDVPIVVEGSAATN